MRTRTSTSARLQGAPFPALERKSRASIWNRRSVVWLRALVLAVAIVLGGSVAGHGQAVSVVQFTSASYVTNENATNVFLTVERIGELNGPAYIEYRTVDETARNGEDYREQVNTLYFYDDVTNLTIVIRILNNALWEGNETFRVELTGADSSNTVLGARSNVVVTLVDDDHGVFFTATIFRARENAGQATMSVSRTSDNLSAFSVDCAVTDISTVAGEDYAPWAGPIPLQFAAGQTNQTFQIELVNDAVREANETVLFTLSNPTAGIELAERATALLIIEDDDTGVEFSAGDYSVNEDGGSVTITVQRSGGSAGPFTVDYATRDLTATRGIDYGARDRTLSFTDGETNKTFTVPIFEDSLCENDESFEVVLSSIYGAADLGARKRAVVVIRDTDGTGADLQHWQKRAPKPTGSTLTAVAFGNDMFVAVSENVAISSSDGESWTVTAFPEFSSISAMTWANGLFVAVGTQRRFTYYYQHAAVLTSRDGVEWTSQALTSPESTAALMDVAFGNGQFVAVGGYSPGVVNTSPDGVAWTKQSSEVSSFSQAVAYGNGIFVVAGGTNISTSTDGIVWTTSATEVTWPLTSVTYGNGFFVAISSDGTALRSTDGQSWEVHSTADSLSRVTFGNGLFVAVGYHGSASTSPDGANWTTHQSSASRTYFDDLYAVCHGNGKFVAVGYAGNIRTSSDGNEWQSQNHGTGAELRGVTYGEGLFVAVGGGGSMVTSPDGNLWTNQTNLLAPMYPPFAASYTWHDVAYGAGTFVAVGGLGARYTAVPFVASSSDGLTWSAEPTLPGGILSAVTFGNGTFVAVGGGYCGWDCYDSSVFTSSDGIDWHKVEAGFRGSFTDVTYGNRTFVAIGAYDHVIFTSPDGENWTQQNSSTMATLLSVAYGNGTFIVTGYIYDGVQSHGVILASPDGIHWTPVYSVPDIYFSKATFGNGTFVALTYDDRFLTSSDALNWVERSSGQQDAMYDVVAGNGTFVSVGSGGTILQTERLLKLGLRAGNPPELSITGPVGAHRYRLEACDDLAAANWVELETISVTNTPHIWRDTTATNSPARFYRAVLLP